MRVFALALCLASASACQSAMSLIESAEGFRSCEYVDSTGHKTICYGFNLDKSGAKAEVEAVGGDYEKVCNGGCLTKSQCQQLLSKEVSAAASGAEGIFGQQCSCIMAVLTDMTYNLGTAGMEQFNTFKGYIEKANWSAAASDIKGTLWCRQVGSRCSRDASIIADGCSQRSLIDIFRSAADALRASVTAE